MKNNIVWIIVILLLVNFLGFAQVTINPVQPICGSQSLTLTASGASEYSWSPSIYLSSTSGSVITATPPVSIVYTVTGYNGGTVIGTAGVSITVTTSVLPPEIRCASVDTAGNATLTWVIPNDPSVAFDSYHIYASNNAAGLFTEIDSIFTYTQSSYIHSGAGAQLAPKYYYIRTRFNCNGKVYSIPSNTIKTIFLDVVNLNNGVASLSWNKLNNPDLPTSLGAYRIYREYPAGVWTMIATTTNLNYSDTVKKCSVYLRYRVEIDDNAPCTSVSSINDDIIKDLTPPVATDIDTVSVDDSGKATISWIKSVSADTRCYVIYQLKNSVWTAIDTICNSSTFMQNLTSNADKTVELYTIAAIDSCGNISPMSKYHRTFFLNVNTDICSKTNSLAWNSYVNMNPQISGYKIYVSQNAGPYTLLAMLNTRDTTYTHSNLQNNTTYCYFIQAYSVLGQKSSSSNVVCKTFRSPKSPQFCYLKYATVLSDKTVEVSFYIDISGHIKKCNIVRSEDLYGTYSVIATINDFSSAVINYIDTRASVNSKSYCYKVIVIDSCDNEIIASNVGITILLTVKANLDMSNSVIWNDYQDWLGGVKGYTIYRAIDETPPDGSPIINLPRATTYTDFVNDYYNSEGSFKYYIRAIEDIDNPYGFTDSSTSNVVEVYQTPKVFVPSAFDPYGLYRVLKPVGSFINAKDYEFLIYNRWGALIFKSNSPEEGWDGKIGSNIAPIGVYIYLLKFNNFEGSVITKRGSISVLY
ncbi:MAG: gliding motility-associated C-terminal domain-containing protein [Bacteroidales bacterium]|jgi:hypothetical protein